MFSLTSVQFLSAFGPIRAPPRQTDGLKAEGLRVKVRVLNAGAAAALKEETVGIQSLPGENVASIIAGIVREERSKVIWSPAV